MSQQRALTATAAAHDNEDIAVIDGEVEITHQNKSPVSHGEIADSDVGSMTFPVRRWDGHISGSR